MGACVVVCVDRDVIHIVANIPVETWWEPWIVVDDWSYRRVFHNLCPSVCSFNYLDVNELWTK